MKPCSFTSLVSSAATSFGYSGTKRSPFFTIPACPNASQVSTPGLAGA